MSTQYIVLTEEDFKSIVAAGFITGQLHTVTNYLGYPKEALRQISKETEDELWQKVLKAYEFEVKQGLKPDINTY